MTTKIPLTLTVVVAIMPCFAGCSTAPSESAKEAPVPAAEDVAVEDKRTNDFPVVAGGGPPSSGLGEDVELPMYFIPPELEQTPNLLSERKRVQLAFGKEYGVFVDWQFNDQRAESGIDFLHRVVGDAGKTYESVHYDHGNGLAVADVDGDGKLDLYFINQIGSNQLWRNLGDGRFEEITESASVGLADRVCVSASFADVDNDGDADLYVTSVRDGNVLFENDGSGVFQDVTEPSGLGHRGHSSGVVFFDFDRDGLLDLFLTNVGQYTLEEQVHMPADVDGAFAAGDYSFYDGIPDSFAGHLKPERFEQSLLFRNLGKNRFADVSEEMNLKDMGWTGDATPLYANADPWPDLYVLSMQGPDQYYENNGGTGFINRTKEVFPRTPWGAMGVKAFDYDNDGDQDLFVTDMHSDMSEEIGWQREKLRSRVANNWTESYVGPDEQNIYGNAFFRNDGDGKFTEVSGELNAENYWPWGLSTGDLNADGFEDVFITASMNYPFRYGVNSVLLNDRGRQFLDSEFILNVEPRRNGQFAAPWFVVDSDRDKFQGVRKSYLEDFAATYDGQFVVWGAVGSRASAIFDLDDDGDLDIVTSEFNSHPLVLISNLSEQLPDLRYLKVKLIGNASNRSGLGAVVRVSLDSTTQTQIMDGKSGYLSQSLMPLYFGLSNSEPIRRIEVDWPSGIIQEIAGPIETNRVLEIAEPQE